MPFCYEILAIISIAATPALSSGVSSLGVPGGGALRFWQISQTYLNQEDRLCPPNYYWHPLILRPSDGPDLSKPFCGEIPKQIHGNEFEEFIQLLADTLHVRS